MVLTSLRTFLLLETEYSVHAFTSPAEALAHLEVQPADVIVSDYMMPGLNGLQTLERARELQPEAARILLTGHADKQSAIQAINRVGLYQYLEKPWDNSQFLLVLKGAVERTRLLRQLAEMAEKLDGQNGALRDFQGKLLKAFL
jgi:DNA-binding NtrC family response regulator